MNYLASPPLVIAYALAGTMDFDFETRAARAPTTDGNDVFLHGHLAVAAGGRTTSSPRAINQEMFTKDYADVFEGDERWRTLPTPSGNTFEWDAELDLRAQAPVLRRHAGRAGAGHRHRRRPGAGAARRLGHHRPHLPGRHHQGRTPRPAQYLDEHGVERKDFNSYGSRRGNHEVMIRGTFANIRLRNQLLDGVDGRLHPRLHPGRRPAGVHLRRRAELRGRRHPAGRAGRQGVRLRLVARLGGQGHRAARRARRHRRVATSASTART